MAPDNFKLTKAAALKYEAHSVPAMFAPLARATLDKINMPTAGNIVDVACGTGALTRLIAEKMPGRGKITGTDLNETMIEVAKATQPDTRHEIYWCAADVGNLPFDDGRFDMAFVQQGLQFFPEKAAALAEIRRVLRDNGRLILTCWRAISPFNQALAEALARHVGDAAAEKARAPFSFRDGTLIAGLLRDAGFVAEAHDAIVLHRRFADLGAQIMALPVEKDLRAKGVEATDLVISQVATALEPYNQDGVFVVPQEAHFFDVRKY